VSKTQKGSESCLMSVDHIAPIALWQQRYWQQQPSALSAGAAISWSMPVWRIAEFWWPVND